MNEETIFSQAIEKPECGRSAYLDQVCGDDAELRGRVEALLAAHNSPDSFLEDPVGDGEPTIGKAFNARPGAVIGPYKLREQIGEGGMGVVWAAEQKQPLRRKVALKLIKPGMDSTVVIARFEAEREALSLMDHPNVARVLDAGTTEQGHPYFVMELICGVPITEYCDTNKLSVPDRLDLFTQVCRAVQHAHQKGIIHRDIKPTNVLVTMHDDEPVPKVIDFGVAKALRQSLTDHSVYTGVFQAIGTLAYMSPEQAQLSGLNIDTRADIYGLGVLLYELLTGVTPFDKETLASAALDEAYRIIREQEPPKPSTKLSTLGERFANVSRDRSSNLPELGKTIRGDLDWIVMKSLDKNRTRRYETASSFATDIQRFLSNEPIEARPPSVAYRCRKFVRRNRTIVAGVSVALIALVLGTVGTTAALVRERRTRQELEQIMAAHCEELKRAARDTAMSGDKEQTEKAIERAIGAGASDEWADFVWAQFAFFRGEWKRAIKFLESVIDRESNNLPAAALLCEAHLIDGDLDSYAHCVGVLQEITPENGLEVLLKAKATRFGRPDKSVSIEMIDSLPNWRISPWARGLRSEVLATMAQVQLDPDLAEEAVEEAFVAYKLLPDSAPCFLSLLKAQNTCHSVYLKSGDKVNSDRQKVEMLQLCTQADAFRKHCGGLVEAVEAEFFESIGDIEAASQRWIALTKQNRGGWKLTPAVYFFQRSHQFDRALDIWENGNMAPFGQLGSATILLEFPNRHSTTRQEMRELVNETPDRYRHYAVAAMCMFGNMDLVVGLSEDLLESNTTANVNTLGFLAGRKTEPEYFAAVRRDGKNLGDAHLVTGFVHLGQHHLNRAARHFSDVSKADDATVGALAIVEVLLQRMREDENWPHLPLESSDGQSAPE